MINKVHLYIGTIFMIVFLLTGQYFAYEYGGLPNTDDVTRLMYRSVHVYLFFAAFVNIIFGLYYKAPEKITIKTWANQGLIFLSPVILAYSFCFEVLGNTSLERPIGTLGVALPFFWLANRVVGTFYQTMKQKLNNTKNR